MTEERARQTKYDLIDAASSEIANIIISETGVEAQTRATCAASSAMLERLDELMLVLEAAKSASCRYENFLHGGAGNGQHVSEIQAAAKNLKMIFARIDNIGSKVAGLHGSVELMEKDVEALVSTMERPGERQQGLQGESNDRLTNKAASALANMRAVGSQSIRSAQIFAKRMFPPQQLLQQQQQQQQQQQEQEEEQEQIEERQEGK